MSDGKIYISAYVIVFILNIYANIKYKIEYKKAGYKNLPTPEICGSFLQSVKYLKFILKNERKTIKNKKIYFILSAIRILFLLQLVFFIKIAILIVNKEKL